MKRKTEQFLEELKSWRQENPDKRNFIVIVNERDKHTTVGIEGDSTAISAALLSSTVSGQLSTEDTAVFLDTADKIKFIVDNMDDFLNWCRNGKKKSADS